AAKRGEQAARDADDPAARQDDGETAEDGGGARHGRKVEAAGVVFPRLVRGESEMEVRPDEGREASPQAEQDQRGSSHCATTAANPDLTVHDTHSRSN